ncbi:bifunctional glycosyltransferase/CDP-glycerol:glycerophosphate glycerophosphotransferase [Streptomyces sp. MZ04]|uniref:bifunctional glycosyltransferase/CDP-glycerol:glycerophosphate glycerophosphotransferase n=1 Tax=Streptomyces sp. MZ04 TaxID=2559236 RepID=UPI00107E813F|nr:bifunctional glycosyltransferase/CDP-glycerol:glycerophosphate glycerophosphotransferase [Streptomyces sp. MZ04]TGA90133.1 glycosyltransferase [Streptomyces sp. MZ04]
MTPRLAVVVPVYNVEEFLGSCLRSLAEQTMPDFEVVMVNDGSTDGSPRIAREFAARDGRFRLVEQENAGLGAARNAGVREARGTYLAFVDSDDIVPPDAYERMLAALEESGSDFVTGNVHRLRSDGVSRQSPMFRKAMEADRSGTHVTRDWGLLGDRIACNKVFRRTFWDRHGLAFPEGVLFEDTPVMIPLHFLADAVDVLKDPVYLWRDRHGSITNGRARPRAVRDRAAAVIAASGFLAGKAGETEGTPEGELWAEAKRRYDRTVFSGDLWLFMEALPHGDAEYHEAFLEHAGAFAATVDRSVVDGLPLALRVRWRLVAQRRAGDLMAFMAYEKSNPDAFRVRGLRRRRADYPGIGGLPRETVALKRSDVPLTAQLTHAAWDDEGLLRLKGFAYIRNLPAGRIVARARVAWLRSGRWRVLPLKLRTVRAREATYRSNQGLHSYDRSGFETVVDPRRIVTKRRSTTWNVEMGVVSGLLPRTGPVRMSGLPALPVRYLEDFLRVAVTLSTGRLRLRTERVAARLVAHEGCGGAVRLHGRLAPGESQAIDFVRVENWHTKEAHDVPAVVNGRDFSADVPLGLFRPEVDERTGEPRKADPWGVALIRDGGERTPLAAHPEVEPGRYGLRPGRELLALANASGNLELRDQTVRPLVDRVTWDGELVLEGSHPGDGTRTGELLLVHGGHGDEAVLPVRIDGGRFTAALRPEAVPGKAGTLPLAEGRWNLFLREPGESDPAEYTPVCVAPGTDRGLPLTRTLSGREITLKRHAHYGLHLRSGSALPPADRGGPRQRRLRETYAAQRGGPLRDAVLYCSFDGRQYSDSPRAIHEELVGHGTELEHLWVVRDQQVDVPESAAPIAMWSAEWYEALARCRHIVTNTQLPDWFERAEGQFVVQTWHGTPLKRIGRDLAGHASGDTAYMATLPARAAQWSVLVSPNRFSTPLLRGAFGHTGAVLECGYPRNDLLHAVDREKVAASVRERLGIPEDRRVVLYAPTWRENQPKRGGRYGLDLRIDLAAAERAIGDDQVLLVRRHYLVGGTVPESDFVRDVTRYPDVSELLLISDVLVTDYSSLMFDFAQTGRPMLFHTYDLDHYRDTLRGFYFDFAAQAPGPLLTTGDEVIEALRDPRAATAAYADAYDRFREVFCDLDDGHAAAGVVDAMLAGAVRGDGMPEGGRA